MPLTPLEFYYWCDDRPEYPACFPFELSFSGRLDRAHFEAAWGAAIARHPMLCARIDEGERQPMWVECADQAPVDWADQGVPVMRDARKRIDLTQGSGVKAWVRVGGSQTRLRVRFHHACCDGQGALQFLEDLLVCYHAESSRPKGSVQLAALRPKQLADRGKTPQLPQNPPWRLKLHYVRVLAREWAKLWMRTPGPLAPPEKDQYPRGRPGPDIDFATRSLDLQTVDGLRRYGLSSQVMLNDVFVRDLFQVVADWNLRRGGSPGDWLRVNMPVSLRVKSDRWLPAANRLSFAFLTRRAKDCRDGKRLIESIAEETGRIKDELLSLCFIGGLDLARGVPGLIPWVLNRKRCYATIVLSNLGRVLKRTSLPRQDGRLVSGNVRLEAITAVPPIRPFTHASIVVMHYAGRTTISLQSDSRLFNAAQTDELLGNYVEKLQRTSHSGG